MQITKADGTKEQFKPGKLRSSLRKSGAHKEEAEEILKKIEDELYEGMRTEEIYRKAFEYLRTSEASVVARYSLRRALFGLGPTGFPFEEFLSRLFATDGYTTKTQVILKGKCATHELDLASYKEDHAFVAEAKFHARPGIKSDLQVVMYCYARLLDLSEQKICTEDICGIKDFWVITNTKFTTAAHNYADCVGMKLLSWDTPKQDNLYERIQNSGLYPITVLQSLRGEEKADLLSRNIVVCQDILEKPRLLRRLHLSTKRLESILAEAEKLTNKAK